MDWRYSATEMAKLARTVAFLLSLAFSAEFAVNASPAKRRRMLDIIRAAESSGLWFAANYGEWDDVECPHIGDGNTPDDALRLAVSLRAIAMALYFQVRLGEMINKAQRLVPSLSNGEGYQGGRRELSPGSPPYRAKRGLGFRALDSPVQQLEGKVPPSTNAVP